MPTTLPPISTTTPLVDPRTGILTRTGAAWLHSSYLRQGGQEAATNTELAGGVVANAGHISQVEAGLGSTQTTVEGLEAELSALQEAFLQLAQEVEALTGRVETLEGQVSTLQTTVADQETRLAALEAWKTAVVAGLPAVVTVGTVPPLTDAPASAAVLEDDLSANWRPPINTNDTALQTAVNTIRAALAA